VPESRKDELLRLAYDYMRENGLTDLSLRPLAAAIGSSPRVLLFLFGNKDGLVRALLEQARADELAALADVPAGAGLEATALAVWNWLAAEEHRPLLTLWVQAYAQSLRGDPFAAATVTDWLEVLAATQPADGRDTAGGLARRTDVLAVLRGALLDLLATGDSERTTAAVHSLFR
jgi:AcrR family transcriptional regulator